MRRLLLQIGLVLGSLLIVATFTAKETIRLALLIGKKGYMKEVGPLTSPHNDINLIEEVLTKLDFKVTPLRDAEFRDIHIGIRRQVSAVKTAGPGRVSFVYYSAKFTKSRRMAPSCSTRVAIGRQTLMSGFGTKRTL